MPLLSSRKPQDEEDSDEGGDDVDSSSSGSGSSTANNAALSPATTFNIPQLRDPLGIKPPMRKPEMEEDGDLSPARAIVDPVDQVWASLMPRHQCFIDRWPPDEIAAGGTAEGGREQGAGPSLEVRMVAVGRGEGPRLPTSTRRCVGGLCYRREAV